MVALDCKHNVDISNARTNAPKQTHTHSHSQLGDLSNPELRLLTDQLERIRFGGDESSVRRLSVRGLLPDTEHYMTYEGSTTSPACPETVTWIVQNKPIYITKQQVSKPNGVGEWANGRLGTEVKR